MSIRYDSRTNVASNGKCPPFVRPDKKGALVNRAPFLWDFDLQKQMMMCITVDAYASASNGGTTTQKGLSKITFDSFMGAEGRACYRSRLFAGSGIYETATRIIDEDEMGAALGGVGSGLKGSLRSHFPLA